MDANMAIEKKAILPVVGIALLSCIALMLTVIGGLYAYNTFAGSAQPAYAQSSGTDVGPKWTVTPVTVGGNQQYIVVVCEDENMFERGAPGRHMSVYEIRQKGNARGELYLVAARVIEYDSKLGYINDEATNTKGFHPMELKKALDKK